MSKKHNHPFHLVDHSAWPITGSIGAMTVTSGMISWMHMNNSYLYILGWIILIMTMMLWWRDITRESTYQGKRTIKVTMGLKWGMILFIISEVFFFISFFWSFMHSSLAPSMEIGMTWPPGGVLTFDPMQIPMLNTVILVSSGITITWAHHSLMEKKHYQVTQALFITVMLGVYFSLLQMYEYYEAPFSISDSIYGSCFFLMTGFHGLHVIMGTTFLMICLMRHMKNHFSSKHHFGVEAAAWYWHFVDVVWLLLYILVYW